MKENKIISVNDMDKRRKENAWKGRLDNNKTNLTLRTKIEADINKNFEKRNLDNEDTKLNYFLSKADAWEELVKKYGYDTANELWNKNLK
jgi:hypothetical protein